MIFFNKSFRRKSKGKNQNTNTDIAFAATLNADKEKQDKQGKKKRQNLNDAIEHLPDGQTLTELDYLPKNELSRESAFHQPGNKRIA